MTSKRLIGKRISMVHQHSRLVGTERVEISTNSGNDVARKGLRVSRCRGLVVARAGACYPPVCSADRSIPVAGNQHAPPQPTRLRLLNLLESLESPEPTLVRIELHGAAAIGHENHRVVLPDWLEAVIVVDTSVCKSNIFDQRFSNVLCK